MLDSNSVTVDYHNIPFMWALPNMHKDRGQACVNPSCLDNQDNSVILLWCCYGKGLFLSLNVERTYLLIVEVVYKFDDSP